MGRVFFLNPQAKAYHDQMGIKVQNPPELRIIQGAALGSTTTRKKATKKVAKGKRQTMGQRIFESLQNKDPNSIA